MGPEVIDTLYVLILRTKNRKTLSQPLGCVPCNFSLSVWMQFALVLDNRSSLLLGEIMSLLLPPVRRWVSHSCLTVDVLALSGVRSVLLSLIEEVVLSHWWAQRSVMKEPSVIFHLGHIRDNSLTYKPVLFLHRFTILWVHERNVYIILSI